MVEKTKIRKDKSLLKDSNNNKELPQGFRQSIFHPRFMGMLADEVAKMVIERLPKFSNKTKKKTPKTPAAVGGFFLDTSAIIDGRIFDLIEMQLLGSNIVVPDEVLLELKHIADSKDLTKKERGRKGLENLQKVRKVRGVKLTVLSAQKNGNEKKEVDEKLIDAAKAYKGKIITCDYNLEKKAGVHGISAINMHAVAQRLKVAAIPGEKIQIKILHIGKDTTQGVGYLEDGTMVVVEKGRDDVGREVSVVISRVIQTATGKILFAKKTPQV